MKFLPSLTIENKQLFERPPAGGRSFRFLERKRKELQAGGDAVVLRRFHALWLCRSIASLKFFLVLFALKGVDSTKLLLRKSKCRSIFQEKERKLPELGLAKAEKTGYNDNSRFVLVK